MQDAQRAFDRERRLAHPRGLAEQQRPDDRVSHAIGPAGIGDVPVAVAGLQIDAVDHVFAKHQQHCQRIQHALGPAGRAGSEERDEAVGAKPGDGLERDRQAFEFLGKRAVARTRAIDFEHRRAIRHRRQLLTVRRIANDKPRSAATVARNAQFDCFRPERSEERLVDCTDPPGAEHHGEQLGNARQQARHHIARTDAPVGQQMRKLRRLAREVGKRDGLHREVLGRPFECDTLRITRPTAAALVVSIETTRQASGKYFAFECVDRKLFKCFGVVAHCMSPGEPWFVGFAERSQPDRPCSAMSKCPSLAAKNSRVPIIAAMKRLPTPAHLRGERPAGSIATGGASPWH